MSLLLNSPPEIDAKLKEQAAALGKTPEEVVLRALEAHLGASSRPNRRSRRRRKLSHDERAADIRKWAKGHRHGMANADDSRESIYSGRGE